MTNTYYSSKWYMTISNELPMTNDGKTYCKFDLTREKDSRWGCPVNQFGTIEEVLNVLKGWQEIDKDAKYECLKEINAETIKMENDFINILLSKI